MHALRSRRILIPVVAVALVAIAGGVAYAAESNRTASSDQTQQVQTAVARQGSLALTASGTGSLVAAEQVEAGFDTSGRLSELLVQVGNEVQAGQVLARLDDTSARQTLTEAETALRELTSPLAVAQAQLDLADARDALQTAQYTYNVNQEGHRATSDTLKAAKAKLVIAQDQLDHAKDVYDSAPGKTSENANKAQAYLNYISAKKAYATALATYNWYTGHPTEIQQAQLEADVAKAEAQVQQAEALAAALTSQPLPAGAFGSGLTALQQAQANVDAAKKDLAATELRAPIAGTVTAIDATLGETVGSSPVITLMDLSQPRVEFYLDQTDVDKAAVGENVTVTFDAYPDVTYTGSVTGIDPVLTTSNGVAAVHGYAVLTPIDGQNAPRLLVGSSASVDVVVASVSDAVLVPVEALREISPGSYAVFVVDSSGGLAMRPVQLGLKNDTFAAITSGLNAGETVSTGAVKVNS